MVSFRPLPRRGFLILTPVQGKCEEDEGLGEGVVEAIYLNRLIGRETN
jgi:hypothetical protein